VEEAEEEEEDKQLLDNIMDKRRY